MHITRDQMKEVLSEPEIAVKLDHKTKKVSRYKFTDKSEEKHNYFYIVDEKSGDRDYIFIIYPFNIIKIGELIENLDKINLGEVRAHSNFDAFLKVEREELEKVNYLGYALNIETKKSLRDFIKYMRSSIELKVITEHIAPTEVLLFLQKPNPWGGMEKINKMTPLQFYYEREKEREVIRIRRSKK